MTIKTKAALAAQFAADIADNTSRDVTPADVRGAVTDLLDSVHGVYGALYAVGVSAAQSLNTSLAKLTGFAADGLSNGTTPAHATDIITVGTAGVYMVFCQLQGAGEAATEYTFAVTKNTTPETSIRTKHITTGTETFTIALTGLVSCAASDTLSIYAQSDEAGGADYTLNNGQMVIYRIA